MKNSFVIYDINKHSFLADKISEVLSIEEQQRSKQFIKKEDCKNFQIQRILIREYLGSILNLNPNEITILRTELGKPYLRDASLFFNISHSGSYLMIAAHHREIGVDIEFTNVTKDVNKLASKIMHLSELAIFNNLKEKDKKSFFYEIWTKKEAYTKFLGKGLTASFTSIEILKINNVHFQTGKTDNYQWSIVRQLD